MFHRVFRKRLFPLNRLVVPALVLLPLILTAPSPPDVAVEIERIINPQVESSAIWGIYVQDVQSGEVLYQHNAHKALLPASAQKVLTSATAMAALGADYRYETTLYFNGTVQGDMLRGDLIIRGSGDPSFGSVEIGRPDPLRGWARALASMGVRRFQGRIIGDDDVFDDEPYAEGWDVDYLTSQSGRLMGVSTSGLSYNDNVVIVRVQKTDERQVVEIIPPGYTADVNQILASSTPVGTTPRYVTVVGDIPDRFSGSLTLPVVDPTMLTLHSFTQYLKDAGIGLRATLHDVDDLPDSPDYKSAQPLFVNVSPPLRQLAAILNKESNNFYAEQLFRTFSWGGGASGAEQRIKQLLSKAGVKTQTITIKDGSGLSRKDLVTPEAMGRLLTYMFKQPERGAFVNSLARGGERGSTLSGRLSDVDVVAKTGSLDHVRALCGYTTASDGRILAFSVLVNNYAGSGSPTMRTIDQIVRTVAGG